MKVKQITEQLSKIKGSVKEYRTSDGTRIDIAIPSKGVAIELENSYKWINRRVLYNAIKAQRSGFKELIIIYPFKPDIIKNSWVTKYIESIGLKLTIIKPAEVNKLVLLTE